MMTDTTVEKQFHYFGSTAFNWATGDSIATVLASLANMAGTEAIKLQVKANKGLYAWVGRVEVPESEKYHINFFKPQGVKISGSFEFNIMNNKGHSLPIERKA